MVSCFYNNAEETYEYLHIQTILANLCDYSIVVVKLDRDILLKIKSKKGKELFAEVIALAHSLNIKEFSEDVETEEQNTLVSATECDYIQGRYY